MPRKIPAVHFAALLKFLFKIFHSTCPGYIDSVKVKVKKAKKGWCTMQYYRIGNLSYVWSALNSLKYQCIDFKFKHLLPLLFALQNHLFEVIQNVIVIHKSTFQYKINIFPLSYFRRRVQVRKYFSLADLPNQCQILWDGCLIW